MLAFLMFDERKSHEPVQTFLRDEYSWLDSLAGMSNIRLFFFQATQQQGQQDQSNSGTNIETSKSRNPSLEIAAKFGIGPDQLPGIIFFHDLDFDSAETAQGVFCPLSIDSFRDDQSSAEKQFAHLFNIIRDARASSSDAASMMKNLQASLRREQVRGPLTLALRTSLIKLVEYPGKLLDAFVAALGEGLGQGIAGKMYGAS